jgi:hypothetical protein
MNFDYQLLKAYAPMPKLDEATTLAKKMARPAAAYIDLRILLQGTS